MSRFKRCDECNRSITEEGKMVTREEVGETVHVHRRCYPKWAEHDREAERVEAKQARKRSAERVSRERVTREELIEAINEVYSRGGYDGGECLWCGGGCWDEGSENHDLTCIITRLRNTEGE